MEQFAKSLCGHDRDSIYAIINEDSEYVYLVDGRLKKTDKPKKKKIKHVQRIKNLPAQVDEILGSDIYHDDDTRIKNAIKAYNNFLNKDLAK